MDEAKRIARLEERLAWFERHAAEQDKAMLELGDDVARLRKEILALRDRSSGSTSPGESEAQADERPPHY